jgi:transposase
LTSSTRNYLVNGFLDSRGNLVGCYFTVAYDWVHRFNDSGFSSFEQVSNPKGRPPILKAEQLRDLVEVALSSPEERGLPFSNWSVPKLAEYCRSKGLLPPVTDEWVRRLLSRGGTTSSFTQPH